MTTLTPARRRTAPVPDGWTVAGAVVGLGAGVVASFVTTPWKSGPAEWGVDFAGNGGWANLGALTGFVVVAAALVGLATARARTASPVSTGRRALLLAGLGFLTLVAFWSGVPPVLAGGAVGLAVAARVRSGSFPGTAAAALVLAVLTTGAVVYLAFTG